VRRIVTLSHCGASLIGSERPTGLLFRPQHFNRIDIGRVKLTASKGSRKNRQRRNREHRERVAESAVVGDTKQVGIGVCLRK
jgi:hypothetical protein